MNAGPMAFNVKLQGTLIYEDGPAAVAAHAAMMAGRAGNRMLEEGARVQGDTIVFGFEGELAGMDAPATVEGAELGIGRALENAVRGEVVYSHQGGYRRVMTALGHDFWAARWKAGRIGFHEGRANELLVAHFPPLETGAPLRILVPLAGKAVDMRWLADRGHEVVGIEFAWEAVRAFFEEQELDPPITEIAGKPALSYGRVTLVCADMFDMKPDQLGRFDVVYDRAALVALEPSTRARYVEVCRALREDAGATLLISFAYPQERMVGPPWSIDPAAVRELFAGQTVELLETRSAATTPRMAAAGLAAIDESVYVIR